MIGGPTALRQRMLSVAAGIASATELTTAARGLTVAVFDLLECERAYCLFHDVASGVLWSEPPDEREIPAGAGLVGVAAHHRQALVLHLARSHPAYRADVDDPDGRGDERLLVQPIVGFEGQVHAVLVGVRGPTARAFTTDDLHRAATLAADVAPMLEHLERVVEAARSAQVPKSMYRAEALSDRREGLGHGDVVRVTPAWIPAVSWIVIAFAIAVASFLALGRVDQYSTGVGAVRAGDRATVITREAGTLEVLLVRPGDRVEAGQLVARLDDGEPRAELERLDLEYHAHLRKRMRDPSDAQAAQSVLALRGQLDNARARVQRREIRSEHAGVVVDLRGRVGQPLSPGDAVLTMSKPEEPMELVALLPGDDRPQIRPGMELRFQVPGYRHDDQWFRITEVGDAVLGPAEAARLLGPDVGDIVVPTGPSVLVRATIPSPTFIARGEALAFHHGMHGIAEVRLRREPLLHVLLPLAEGARR